MMIQLIGAKRLMMIVVLAGLCSVLGAGAYLYLIPQGEKLEKELRTIKSDISFKRSEADRFRQEMAEIQNEKNTFESLETLGFLGEQSRLDARKRIEAIQSYSRVLSATYNIEPGSVENADTATAADRVVLKSKVTIDIEALDDADVYSFVYLLENAFIGYVAVTSMELERVLDLNEVTLRQIGSGIPTVLVKAKIEMDWKTLMSREQALVIGAAVPTAGSQ